MSYWLIKSDPEEYGWKDLVREGRTAWTGVRNFQARNNLRAMKAGDLCLFYHSGESREVVGVAKVVRAAYADPTASGGDWSCVDVAPDRTFGRGVALGEIKEDPALGGMVFLRQGRLSVSPVTKEEFQRIRKLGRRPSPDPGNNR